MIEHVYDASDAEACAACQKLELTELGDKAHEKDDALVRYTADP